MRAYPALLLLAACGSEPDVEARLAERRAALGLRAEPMAFADAMKEIERGAYEGLLARVGVSKRLAPDEALDAAVRVSNLLGRVDPATAESRPRDPPEFDARLGDSRRAAQALARALAGGMSGEAEARELLASCDACHVTFRKPR